MSGLKQRQRARTASDPLRKAKADLAAKRELIARGIEYLLNLLDQIDSDPDEEPSLGSDIGVSIRDQRHWAEGATDDREKDNSDKEPSLGALERVDQERWASGCDSDLEEQCEDEGMAEPAMNPDSEHNGDDEPDHIDQACHWQDQGDQTTLVPHTVYVRRRPERRVS